VPWLYISRSGRNTGRKSLCAALNSSPYWHHAHRLPFI
jgi:hypothetical protein